MTDWGLKQKHPILLDLDGDGIEITELDRSTVFMDSEGTGLKNRTAWAGAGDGVLFYDADGDGTISDDREYVFTEWDPTAADDLAALRSRFDTNGDGKLSDAELNNFKVMVTNADGSRSVQTAAALGITEIRLASDTTDIRYEDGSAITGQVTFVQSGTTKVLGNVALVAGADAHCEVESNAVREDNHHRLRSVTRKYHPISDGWFSKEFLGSRSKQMFARFSILLASTIVAGCSSTYPNIRALAAESPGIEIEDVELMAYEEFWSRDHADGAATDNRTNDLFLTSNWGRDQVYVFYRESNGRCQQEGNGWLRCARTVGGGRPMDVILLFEFTPTRTAIRDFGAITLPVL